MSSIRIDDAEAYWRSKLFGGTTTLWRDFDPTDVPDLLPHVILLDVEREPMDFRYKIIGESVLYHFLRNYTGELMSDIAHQGAASRVWMYCETAVTTGQPKRYESPYVGPHKDYLSLNVTVLPFADSSGNVIKILVATNFIPKRDQ